MSKRDGMLKLRQELAATLGCSVEDLPKPFALWCPMILKRGIAEDLSARYPQADRYAISRFLHRWTTHPIYLKRMLYGNNRHDLDGNNVEPIEGGHRLRAKGMLKRQRAEMRQQQAEAAE